MNVERKKNRARHVRDALTPAYPYTIRLLVCNRRRGHCVCVDTVSVYGIAAIDVDNYLIMCNWLRSHCMCKSVCVWLINLWAATSFCFVSIFFFHFIHCAANKLLSVSQFSFEKKFHHRHAAPANARTNSHTNLSVHLGDGKREEICNYEFIIIQRYYCGQQKKTFHLQMASVRNLFTFHFGNWSKLFVCSEHHQWNSIHVFTALMINAVLTKICHLFLPIFVCQLHSSVGPTNFSMVHSSESKYRRRRMKRRRNK